METAKLTNAGKSVKQELVNTVRRETGNEICMTDVSENFINAVNEYVDGFFESVYSHELGHGAYLMTILIKRIEDEV